MVPILHVAVSSISVIYSVTITTITVGHPCVVLYLFLFVRFLHTTTHVMTVPQNTFGFDAAMNSCGGEYVDSMHAVFQRLDIDQWLDG